MVHLPTQAQIIAERLIDLLREFLRAFLKSLAKIPDQARLHLLAQ
jgi:hypothetical protein